jgi:hypothetical protein
MIEVIGEALQPVRSSLQADGYDLIVNGFEDGVLSLEIQAGPRACAECLVPKELMELIIRQSVKTLAASIRLQYPEESKS